MFYPDPNSIVDYLKSQGQPSDMASRTVLAANYGIFNYTGTAAQNVQLLALLKGGTTTTATPTTPLGWLKGLLTWNPFGK